MTYIPVSPFGLALAFGLVGAAALISRAMGLGAVRELLVGSTRAAVQLLAVGYGLALLFQYERAWLVITALGSMLAVAAYTSARRINHGPGARALLPYAALSVGAGAAAALVPVVAWVVRPVPWFEARLLIPIGGMMLSSAMNVVAQVFERFFAQANADAAVIEQLLSLGASPSQATQEQARAAVRAALVPTINGLLTVGLVALPGMMTGQIVSGTAPTEAVRYQLVILYQLVLVAAVSGALAARCARKLAFTPREQLTRWP